MTKQLEFNFNPDVETADEVAKEWRRIAHELFDGTFPHTIIFGRAIRCRPCKSSGMVATRVSTYGKWRTERTYCHHCNGKGYVNG